MPISFAPESKLNDGDVTRYVSQYLQVRQVFEIYVI